MKLVWNWRAVATKAWSMRLIIAASVLSGIEFALPFFTPKEPSGWFAFFAFLCSIAAGVARLVAQPKSLP